MNLEQYQRARLERLRAEKPPRVRCRQCKRAQVTCYCAHIKAFSPATQFVILIHRDEARRTIATGRMAHLCVSNSRFFEGTNFTNHEPVNAILRNPANHCVVLYPGTNSVDISKVPAEKRRALFPPDKQLVVFVIDGTWAQARRIKRLSLNLTPVPLVGFTPPRLSTFRVRKQPHPVCFSTIEAIHYFIELLEAPPSGAHENLLEVFNAMVEQQIEFEQSLGTGWRRALRGQR